MRLLARKSNRLLITITAPKVTSYFQLPTTTINFLFHYKRQQLQLHTDWLLNSLFWQLKLALPVSVLN